MSRLLRRCLIPLAALSGLLAGIDTASAAKTYRWVDAQGVVHYSDTPQPGAQQVTLPPAQTYSAPPAQGTPPPAAAATATATGGSPPESEETYQSCAITQPVAETSLFSPDSVHVAVTLDPPLRDGDRLEVLMDGQPLPSRSPTATSLEAAQPDRGAHVLSAVVRDSSGKMVCSSSGVTFYVQRPSVLAPQAPGKGH
jgi:hypothetical protein